MTLTTIAIAIGCIAVLCVAVDFMAGLLALLHDDWSDDD